MKILMTGSRGYIGPVMAPILVGAGHDVTGLDMDLYRRSTFGPWKESIRTIVKDVRAVEPADLRGFDAVVHLAALSNDPLGDLNPQLTYEINHLASVRLAQVAKASGVSRFVFASSCSNYGAAGDAPVDETADLNPVTPLITRALPAFKPQWDARRGAKQLYDAYRATGLRLEDFEGPRYRRIDQLQSLVAAGNLGEDLRWIEEPVAA